MEAFLLSVLAEFIAGMAVWGVTKNFDQPGAQPIIFIERAYFSTPSFRFTSDTSSEDDAFKLLLIGSAVLTVLIGLTAIATLFARLLDPILEYGRWVPIGLGALGALTLIAGLIHALRKKDWSLMLVALYTLAMTAALYGLHWLLANQPHPPAALQTTLAAMDKINFSTQEWISAAIAIVFEHLDVVFYLLKQLVGLGFSLAVVLYVLEVQLTTLTTILDDTSRELPATAMILAPALAFIASILLGLVG